MPSNHLSNSSKLPPMPKLQRKPYSPKTEERIDRNGLSPSGLGIDTAEVNRIYKKNDDLDFVPENEGYIEM